MFKFKVTVDHENLTDDQRRRAEQIAREIQSDPSSKRLMELENDDEERDLEPKGPSFGSSGIDASGI